MSRQGLRLLLAFLCIGLAAWTCNAMLRPRRVASMTFEQCLQLVRDGERNTIVSVALAAHIREGLDALRLFGPDGEIILAQLAKEASR